MHRVLTKCFVLVHGDIMGGTVPAQKANLSKWLPLFANGGHLHSENVQQYQHRRGENHNKQPLFSWILP